MPSTQEASPEVPVDPWEVAPSLETWSHAAEWITDDDQDEPHILRSLD